MRAARYRTVSSISARLSLNWNETYIKQYREDGLYSLNPDYAPMLFDGESASVYLIGRVLGIAGPELDATPEEIRLYLSASSTQHGREERSRL